MKITLLIKLYKAGKAVEAGALIESGVDINLCTAKGKTALMYAGRSTCVPPCRATDSTRSRYNGATLKGKNALHYSASCGNLKLLRTLSTLL